MIVFSAVPVTYQWLEIDFLSKVVCLSVVTAGIFCINSYNFLKEIYIDSLNLFLFKKRLCVTDDLKKTMQFYDITILNYAISFFVCSTLY